MPPKDLVPLHATPLNGAALKGIVKHLCSIICDAYSRY